VVEVRVAGCGGCEEEEVAFCEVREGVEDGGFGAVEAGCAEEVEDWGAEEGAVEVGGLVGHCGWFWEISLVGVVVVVLVVVSLPWDHGGFEAATAVRSVGGVLLLDLVWRGVG